MLIPRTRQTAVLAACLLASAFCGAPGAEKQTSFLFTAGANLVLVNATVLDRNHRPVRGLTRTDFHLFENKVEQRISYFGEEDLPLSLAIVFDSSGSMEGRITGASQALHAVLDHPGTQDEFSLITFADRAEVAVPWNPDAAEIRNRVARTRAAGHTALLDAIHLALTSMHNSTNQRRAVLVLSDGGDNHSRHSERQITRMLEEADVQMYAVDMTPAAIPGERPAEELLGPDLLERLCSRAGGRYFQVENQRDLEATAELISRETRSQYMLGYAPSNPAADGLFRRVRLQLLPEKGRSGFSVYWRRGYRVPAQ